MNNFDNSLQNLRPKFGVGKSMYFPPAESCHNFGGIIRYFNNLSVEVLLDAYSHGIFPWPNEGVSDIPWYSPRWRGILPLDSAHFSKRLLRTIRQDRWTFTIDKAFEAVIRSCAEPRDEEDGVWITPQMIPAYVRLNQCGYAHSIEVWDESQQDDSGQPLLVGGIYGVAIKRLFAGESMFHRQTDASKAALWFLVQQLKKKGYILFDCQVSNSHTRQFGVIDIPRKEYLALLKEALR